MVILRIKTRWSQHLDHLVSKIFFYTEFEAEASRFFRQLFHCICIFQFFIQLLYASKIDLKSIHMPIMCLIYSNVRVSPLYHKCDIPISLNY